MEDSFLYVLVLVVAVAVFATFALAVYSLYDTRRDRGMRRQMKAIVETLYKLAAFRKSLEGFPAMPKETKQFQVCFLARHTGVLDMMTRFRAQPDWRAYVQEYRVRERFGSILFEVAVCEDKYGGADVLVSDAQVAAADTLFRAVEACAADLSRVFRRIRALPDPPSVAYLRRAACHALAEVGAKGLYDAYVRSYHGGSPAGLGDDHVFLVCAFDVLHRYPDIPVLELCGPDADALLNVTCPYASAATVRACANVLSALRYYLSSRDLLSYLQRAEAGDKAAVAALRSVYAPTEGDLEAKIRRYRESAGGAQPVPSATDLLQAQIHYVFELSTVQIARVLGYRVGVPGDESSI